MRFFNEKMRERIIRNSVMSFTQFFEGTPCWDWIGSTAGQPNPSGRGFMYPRITYRKLKRRGKHYNRRKIESMGAHRMACIAFKGVRFSPRQLCLHLCNNTLCVNPGHLRGGSYKKNNQQTVRDGRHGNGHAHPVRDLHEDVAREREQGLGELHDDTLMLYHLYVQSTANHHVGL